MFNRPSILFYFLKVFIYSNKRGCLKKMKFRPKAKPTNHTNKKVKLKIKDLVSE